MMKIRGKDCSLHALLINTDCSNVDVLENAAIRVLLKSISYARSLKNITAQDRSRKTMKFFECPFCLRGKEEMSIKRTDAIKASLIASSCETSHRTRKPVQLNLSN